MINWNNVFFLCGVAAVVVMLFTFDVSFVELWQHLCKAGYWLIPIVGIWLVVYAINALSWMTVIRGTVGKEEMEKDRLSGWRFLLRIYRLTITGYALNYATPVGGLGGEPYRIMELSKDISKQSATSSVILYAMMHVFAHFWFWFTSVFLYLALVAAGDLPFNTTVGIVLGIIIVFCLIAFYLFSRGYRYGLVVRVIRWIGHLPFLKGWSERFLSAHEAALHNVDAQIAALHQQSRRHFYVALGLEYLSRIVQSSEVLFMLLLFGVDCGGGFGGITMTFLHSILIVSLTTLFANLIGFLPMQIGVQEGGFALSTAAMGLSTALGLFVSIICRVREIIWIFIGIVLMRVGGRKTT
ncbi:MAG: flippase-like domain-containing protein [Prevotellaceae bacterium]|nr:flippase-like domain-containing protein [Prevotellaceae bacterium]